MNEITSITTSVVTNMMSTSVCVEWRTTPAEFRVLRGDEDHQIRIAVIILTQVPTV